MDNITFTRTITKRRRKRRRGAKEVRDYEGPDLISRLPCCVLGAIVTLLPTAEGARTAILSRRWRHVWRSSPLNLDGRFKSVYFSHERIQVMSQILDSHRGPVRRFASTYMDPAAYPTHFEDWFSLAKLDGLQDLVIHSVGMPNRSVLPISALRFASLRVLDIVNCTFPTAGGCSPAFPCLSYLSLRDVGITEELLHAVISSSLGIETIVLDTNFGHRQLCLSMPRLKYLAVSTRYSHDREPKLEHFVIQDAVSLERLLLHEVYKHNGPCVRITGTTKLKILGYIGTGFPTFQLDSLICKSMIASDLAEQFASLRILALEMPESPNLKVAISYLRCFPCLEKLTIKFVGNRWMESPESAVQCDASSPVECLDRSLKTIVLRSFSGRKPHVEFAKFFVKRARVLEVMKFFTPAEVTPEWLENQCRKLDIEYRASRCAQFPFAPHHNLLFWMNEALTRDDPFTETLDPKSYGILRRIDEAKSSAEAINEETSPERIRDEGVHRGHHLQRQKTSCTKQGRGRC